MGLFSSKKIITVASTLYNMAGDEEDRPNFLKSTMFAAVMSPHDPFMGETIVSNYLTGPGIRQRSFFNWAKRNDYPGLPVYSASQQYTVDPTVVSGQISIPASPAGLENQIQAAYVVSGEYEMFAEKWILENDPEKISEEWTAEYFSDNHTIVIQFENGDSEIIPAGVFSSDGEYVVVYYFQSVPQASDPVNQGTLETDEADVLNLPDDTGYTQNSFTNTTTDSFDLDTEETVVKTYSDATPTDTQVTTTTVTETYNNTLEISSLVQYLGGDGESGETHSQETFINLWERRHVVENTTVTTETNDMGGGVTETVTTTTVTETLEPIWDYRIDTQNTTFAEVVGGSQIFIYKLGTGNVALDGLQQTLEVSATAEYFPFIPIRLDNKSVLHEDYATLYAASKTAYRRATGGQKLLDVVEQVEENDDIDDIDYAYICFGVSLNVIENSCKKYLYEYFKTLIPLQSVSGAYVTNFINDINNYASYQSAYDAWVQEQNSDHGSWGNVYTPPPPLPSRVMPETTTVRLRTDSPDIDDFDLRLTWISIQEEFFSGVSQAGATAGDAWVEKGSVTTWTTHLGTGNVRDRGFSSYWNPTNTIEQFFVYWQTDADTYKRITVYGMVSENFIYGGKSVRITAHEALDDTDPSGFLVPLHDATVRAMPLVDSTQMATANTHIMFNSYQVTKKKWYQTFLGFLFIIIAIIIVAVLINPAAIGGLSGALGTNAAVGGALGLTGTAAIVAGAVTNALAAIIISQAITTVSVAAFGEKWGSIIGAIASFAVNFGMTNGFGSFNMTSFMTPQNLLAFSGALANGYAGWTQANIAEIQEEMAENQSEFDDQMDHIQDLLNQLGGNNDLSFNPMSLTDSAKGNGSSSSGSYLPETVDEFIHRTTMTGSDIVEITLAMVTDFTDLSLMLPEN